MKSSWTKGLTIDDKKLMEGYFNGSLLLRDKLTKIVEDKILSRDRSLHSLALYESPCWSHLQADGMGYERALREVLELIENNS
tara:strand:+ start:420 stop:668 length:249 start_codon:yes stop_codon:yes gene_type:complete